ncbi:unnamed protein product [Durusdinium trenchii]|uniref:Alpha-1,3-glucosyltransferase n=1 Tax=Durusdinium trenchii TaxID=1381693 RepID=A0ABP0QII7_9DINO
MLLGLLLLSIAAIERQRTYLGAVLFCLLLCMKHIFLYVSPVFFVYLLRFHCDMSFWPFRLRFGRLLRLGLVVLGSFLDAWAETTVERSGMACGGGASCWPGFFLFPYWLALVFSPLVPFGLVALLLSCLLGCDFLETARASAGGRRLAFVCLWRDSRSLSLNHKDRLDLANEAAKEQEIANWKLKSPFQVLLAPFLSPVQMPQLLKRLFPFGRGLTHAYWAPSLGFCTDLGGDGSWVDQGWGFLPGRKDSES